jgi:hypothetical protein
MTAGLLPEPRDAVFEGDQRPTGTRLTHGSFCLMKN